MIARIWSGESPLWLLLLPLSWLYGLVSGIIRLLYRLFTFTREQEQSSSNGGGR